MVARVFKQQQKLKGKQESIFVNRKSEHKSGRQEKSIYIIYTLFYIIFCMMIVYCFHAADKTLICSGDAYVQGLPGVVKQIRYMKDIIRQIIIGNKLEIPLIDYSVGFGMDTIIHIFHFPIVLIGVLCPEKYYVRFYQLVPFALLYVAGLSFILFCRKIKIKKNHAVLIGCMVWLSGGYSLFSLTRYLSFIYPMVYLPLCLSGAEDVIRKKKIWLFVLSGTVLFTVSWYFGYMVSVFVVFYCFIRLFPMLQKRYYVLFFKTGFHLAGAYLLGMMLSGCWLLPGIYGYFNSSRAGEHTEQAQSLWHYGFPYYKQLFSGFIVPGMDSYYEMFTGFLPAALIALIILFVYIKRNRYRMWKRLFLSVIVFAAVPVFGILWNGGGYVSNRWCFCMAFVLSVVTAAAFSELDELPNRRIRILSYTETGITAVFTVWALQKQENCLWTSACILFGYAGILFLYQCPGLMLWVKRILLSVFTICSVFLFLVINFHPQFSDYHQRFLPRREDFHIKYLAKAADIRDEEFYRIGAPWNETNFSMYYDFYGTSGYTNLIDKSVSEFFGELALNTKRYSFQLTGIDGRAVLNDLFAVKYYASNLETMPYGFDECKRDMSGMLAVADASVSPVHIYDNYMKKEYYRELMPLQRQEALGQTVILEQQMKGLKEFSYEDHYRKLPYQVTELQNVEIHGNQIEVHETDARMTISFQAQENAETYLDISGLQLLSDKNILTVYTSANGHGNRFLMINQGYQYYVDDRVTVNLGYAKEGLDTCTLIFSEPGQFCYDSIEIFSYPMEQYEMYKNHAVSQNDCNFQMRNNQFTCDLTLSDQKLVQFSIPYSIGWKAYIDGKETEIYRTDTMFMSVLTEPGKHNIRFSYCTPLLKQGMALSMTAFVILVFTNWKRRRT